MLGLRIVYFKNMPHFQFYSNSNEMVNSWLNVYVLLYLLKNEWSLYHSTTVKKLSYVFMIIHIKCKFVFFSYF